MPSPSAKPIKPTEPIDPSLADAAAQNTKSASKKTARKVPASSSKDEVEPATSKKTATRKSSTSKKSVATESAAPASAEEASHLPSGEKAKKEKLAKAKSSSLKSSESLLTNSLAQEKKALKPLPLTSAHAPASTTRVAESTVTPVQQPRVEVSPSSTMTSVAVSAASSSEDSLEEESKNIMMKPPIIVKELAVRLGCKPFQLIHELMEINIFATLNQAIDEEQARKIAEKRGFTFNVEKREKGAGVHKVEPVVQPPPPPIVQDKHLKSRPPIVTFMGHVDHGKTSLLDAIRQARVAAGEAGGITQHIGAYTVERGNQSITFLDTPGHEAFTAMRARGANVTDIAVIVCAADDGVMPQTIEAIKHAQAAQVTIMVAINKIDSVGSNPDRVKKQFQEYGLVPEDWGGQTIFCEVSATKKIGIEKLIEMILLQAEILELKVEPSGPARGVVVESQLEQGRGPTATVLIRQGTLKMGDFFVCGTQMGKVKALINDLGKNIQEALPSQPAKIIGFSGTPIPGEEFIVTVSEKEARQIHDERQEHARTGKLTITTAEAPVVTLENLFSNLQEGQPKVLNLILKADVQGSIEAIVDSLKKIKSTKIGVNFILTGVGPITVSDVLLAKASSAVIIGFNTKTDNTAAGTAKKEMVQIKLFSIIYELIDQVREAMAGMLDPETRETQIGTAIVKKVFELSKFPVAGCMVQTGRISKGGRARVVRKRQPIYDGAIVTLKRFQDEANEVRAGVECGIRLGNFTEYLADDIIECYILEKVAQTL